MPPLILVGPTASGKSALAMALARRIDGEIVCCDALQIYREADIVTAKPTRAEREEVPHHLVDICQPDERFSALQWANQARTILVDIEKRGKRALICGGTGFYLRALLQPETFDAPASHPELRRALEQWIHNAEPSIVRAAIEKWAPDAAKRLSTNDVFRIARALEIALIEKHRRENEISNTSGEINGAHSVFFHASDPFHFCVLPGRERVPARTDVVLEGTTSRNLSQARIYGLQWERDSLYARINSRVDAMMDAGADVEARTLRQKWGADAPFASGVGYKALWAAMDGEVSTPAAVEAWKRDSRRYAKRQMTWFRHQLPTIWLDAARGVEELASEIERQTRTSS